MTYKKQFIRKGNKKYQELQRMKHWSNGKLVKVAKLDWDTNGIWEELKSYVQNDGSIKIFRLEEHIDRLYKSAKILNVEISEPKNKIIDGCKSVVEANVKEDLELKIIIKDNKINILARKPEKHKDKITAIISNIPRGYPIQWNQCFCGRSYLADKEMIEAEKRGLFDEVLLTDSNQHVYSGFKSNLFIILGDIIITPPNDGSILMGITRRTVVEILQNLALMFKKYKKSPIIIEKSITIPDIYMSDAIFLTSTYGEIRAIEDVDYRTVNTTDNFYYKLLKEEYSNLIRGRI